ncbi:MAG: hypothetical protein E3J81_09000 [Dehalococcoidia bacterium]|nr:MAG: hypothetical protein E3J81_09000 [Dehalococcoidia bacterium]
MTENDKIYAAAFIDGEGCISTHINRRKNVAQISVSVTNTDPTVIHWLQDLWSGVAGCTYAVKETEKPVWYWRVTARKAERFLNDVRPYLKMKVHQANLALNMRSLMGPRGKRVPRGGWAEREAVNEAMRILNKVGR